MQRVSRRLATLGGLAVAISRPKSALPALSNYSGAAPPWSYGPIMPARGEDEFRDRIWLPIAPLGDHPFQGNERVLQRVDGTAVEAMANSFGKVFRRNLFRRGFPIFEGHPDDKKWRAERQREGLPINDRPIGRGKDVRINPQTGELEYLAVFNARGVELLSGEAATYDGFSPRWLPEPIGREERGDISPEVGVFRPVEILSVGILNDPGIPSNRILLNSAGDDSPEPEENEMKLSDELLARLGLAPDSAEEEIAAAIEAALDRNEELEAAARDDDGGEEFRPSEEAGEEGDDDGASNGGGDDASDDDGASNGDGDDESDEDDDDEALANSDGADADEDDENPRQAIAASTVDHAISIGQVPEADREARVEALANSGGNFGAMAAELLTGSPAMNTSPPGSQFGDRRESALAEEETPTARIRRLHDEALANDAGPERGKYDRAWRKIQAENPDLFR